MYKQAFLPARPDSGESLNREPEITGHVKPMHGNADGDSVPIGDPSACAFCASGALRKAVHGDKSDLHHIVQARRFGIALPEIS